MEWGSKAVFAFGGHAVLQQKLAVHLTSNKIEFGSQAFAALGPMLTQAFGQSAHSFDRGSVAMRTGSQTAFCVQIDKASPL